MWIMLNRDKKEMRKTETKSTHNKKSFQYRTLNCKYIQNYKYRGTVSNGKRKKNLSILQSHFNQKKAETFRLLLRKVQESISKTDNRNHRRKKSFPKFLKRKHGS
jgi:hypothetical protein